METNHQEEITAANQPFHTSNAILAFCLWRAGVQFWDAQNPCIVLYDVEIIRKFVNAKGEPVFKGVGLKEATIHAHKRGFRGHVIYIFQPNEELKKLCAAFRDQEEILKQEDVTVDTIVKNIIGRWNDGLYSDAEAVLRLACVDLKTRVPFMELWQQQVPLMRIPNEGEIETHEEMINVKIDGKIEQRLAKVVNHPGVRVVSVNASPETLQHLGVEK